MSILDELLPLGPKEAEAIQAKNLAILLEAGPPPASDWPAGLPDHLSASQLSMFERCPEQYRQRYVLGKKEAPSGAMLWGTSDGRAHAEANFNQKIESHEDTPVAEVEEAFASILDEEVEKNGGAGEIDWRDDDPADIKDRGVLLVAHYHEKVSPRIQPTATEERFSLEVPGIPVPFIGYIDVSTEAYTIERKTARGSSKVIPPQYVLQTLGYAWARSRPVEMHISTRTVKPAVYTPAEMPGLLLPHASGLDMRASRIVASRARALLALWRERGPDEPWPDAIGTMAWNMPVCDLCGYRANCSWWEGSEPSELSSGGVEGASGKPAGNVMADAGQEVGLAGDSSLGFGDTPSSGRAPEQSVLEREIELLTGSLLSIAGASGKNLDAIAAVVKGNRDSHAGELEAHKAWLERQLTKAEAAS